MSKTTKLEPTVPIEKAETTTIQFPEELEAYEVESPITKDYGVINKPIVIDNVQAQNNPYLFYKQNNTIFNYFILTSDVNRIENRQGINYKVWFMLQKLEESLGINSDNVDYLSLFSKTTPIGCYSSRENMYKKNLVNHLKNSFKYSYKLDENFFNNDLKIKQFSLVNSGYFWIGNRIEYIERDNYTDEILMEVVLNMIPNTNLFSRYMLSKIHNSLIITTNSKQLKNENNCLITFLDKEMVIFLSYFQKYVNLNIDILDENKSSLIINAIEKKEYDDLLSFTFIGDNYKIYLYYAKNMKIPTLNFESYILKTSSF